MPVLVTAVIKPFKLDDVKRSLRSLEIGGMTVTEVNGFGRQGGKTESFRGSEYTMEFVPKVRIEVVVPTADMERTIDAIADAAHTGKVGDGKIWAYELKAVQRVRTSEKGDDAI